MNPTLRFLDHDADAARIRQIVEERAKEVLAETNPIEAEQRF